MVVLNDPATGVPRAILDGADHGAADRGGQRAWPSRGSARAAGGSAGRSAASPDHRCGRAGPQPPRRCSGTSCPGVDLAIYRPPRGPRRPRWRRAARATPGIGAGRPWPPPPRTPSPMPTWSSRPRRSGADAAPGHDRGLAPRRRPRRRRRLRDATASAALARAAAMFLVDERGQFLAEPRRRAVRRLSRTRRRPSARRSSRARHRRRWARARDPPRRRPGGRRLRRRDRGSCATSSASGRLGGSAAPA